MGAKALGVVPGSDSLHYVLQRHVTRSLPTSRRVFRRQRARAVAHVVEAYLQHGPDRPLSEAVFYEFGAGWDLTIPLVYRALGVERQVLVDIRPNMRLELVNHTLRRLRKSRGALRRISRRPVRGLGPSLTSSAELETRFGIRYLAPCDARATGLPSASVDFASSTSTLEHIPEPDIVPILAECRRLLKPDGVLSARIDMRDHFSYADPRVSPYSFLRYSPRAWRLLNSRLLYQNRLRLPDHLRLIEAAGFELVAVDAHQPGGKAQAELGSVPIAHVFRGYSPEELAVGTAFVVARPAARGTDPASWLATKLWKRRFGVDPPRSHYPDAVTGAGARAADP